MRRFCVDEISTLQFLLNLSFFNLMLKTHVQGFFLILKETAAVRGRGCN